MPAENTGIPRRVGAAWRNLERSERRCVTAALLMLLSMLLPWYSRNSDGIVNGALAQQSSGKSAILVFTFVEAAILLVCVALLLLFFARGERRGFHLPGGDGLIVTIAGAWCTFLIFYRFLDKPSGGRTKTITYDYGLSWGIFFGLLAALFLLYAGTRLRGAHLGEPPLPGDVAPSSSPPVVRDERRPRETRRRVTRDQAPTVVAPSTAAGRRRRAPEGQLSFEEPSAPARPDEEDEPPTRRAAPLGEPPSFDDPPPEFRQR